MYALQRKFLYPLTLELINRTEIQLKNAGGMRLIRNKEVSDSIINYWQLKERLMKLKRQLMATVSRLKIFRSFYSIINFILKKEQFQFWRFY